MTNKESFVAYEYKNVTVKRDFAAMYADCLVSFGWTPVEDGLYGFQSVLSSMNPVHLGANIANAAKMSAETADAHDLVALKFKRDRRISNKLEISRLERKCETALAAIGSLERRSGAYTMGASLGVGIAGAAVLGLGVYSFIAANIVAGVLLTMIGIAGWGIGYFAYRKVGKKTAAQTEPMIQEQFDIAYSACEQAHALLA